MPRRSEKVKPLERKRQERTCDECGGKGKVKRVNKYNVPSGVAYQPTGIFVGKETVMDTCCKCGGRGTQVFYTMEEKS